MQFQVPQFLDVEDKVVGPLTIKQFLYSAGGIGMGYMIFRFVPWGLVAFIPALAVAAFGLALGFYRVNNRPFIDFVEAGFYFLMSERLYVWRQQHKNSTVEDVDLSRFKNTQHVRGPGQSNRGGSKLNSLSWQIDLEPGDTGAHEVGFRG